MNVVGGVGEDNELAFKFLMLLLLILLILELVL